MPKTVVVALGGNAFTRAGQVGTNEEQSDNAVAMARTVVAMRSNGWNVVIVHGNGPQVGNLAIQQEEGREIVPAQPLFTLDAMTQGQIGSLISLALQARSPGIAVAALITHVVVSADDPAFASPSKPIGPFFSRVQARDLAVGRGWDVAEDAGRGFRRVVPSPRPQAVVETEAIKALASTGTVVVAGGGGGVPVVVEDTGLRGVEAVIDKDYVACRLAASLAAQALVFVTDVPELMLDFGLPSQRALAEIDVAIAEQYQRDGQFPPGSMSPKVHAATEFLRSGGRVAVITTPELAAHTLDPPGADALAAGRVRVGTRIVADRDARRVAT